ncbi:(Fe-S)-binding protein [Brachyspira innocens]|uniref:(Fe-S)-binding protein n=1 Tax=Brachyspira innocens TaxID=13264 RepID=A0ABT8YXZ5_9SPIR|nr:(Fe-S)-binding protein [Brachyspira innocens]MDO6992555.1 (Fe-S)-binding protein [Brachyspira innocens]MDO7020751.1 (Fe-S)-binding protein [Brachyspira innocens]
MQMPDNVKDCIHCNKCVKKCSFLSKYNIDLEAFSKREDLAYHCFLCNDCNIVCPKDIDGNKISMCMRINKINSDIKNKKEIEKKYKFLMLEKTDYIFKNYKNVISESVIFSGCNFSSFYPDALKYILNKFKKEYNIGSVFDCCGKPIAELGIDEDSIVKKLEDRMISHGVKEIVTLCPNCYYFLSPRINSIRIISIYEKLNELGLKFHLNIDEEINLFIPCPDKKTKHIKNSILNIIDGDIIIKEINDINCCGLGGCAIVNEKEIASGFIEKLKSKRLNNLYVYCATCAGNFNRNKINNVRHLPLSILGIDNLEIKNKSSIINRAMFRFY